MVEEVPLPHPKLVNEHVDGVLGSGIVNLGLLQVMSLHTIDTSHRIAQTPASATSDHRRSGTFALSRTRSSTVDLVLLQVMSLHATDTSCWNHKVQAAATSDHRQVCCAWTE